MKFMQNFIKLFAHGYSIKDDKPLTYFLGVEMVPQSQHLFLSLCKYIKDLFARTRMINVKPIVIL